MQPPDPLDALIDAAEALLGIPIEAEWRGSIRLHLDISMRHALTVASFSLPNETDPAPVFRA